MENIQLDDEEEESFGSLSIFKYRRSCDRTKATTSHFQGKRSFAFFKHHNDPMALTHSGETQLDDRKYTVLEPIESRVSRTQPRSVLRIYSSHLWRIVCLLISFASYFTDSLIYFFVETEVPINVLLFSLALSTLFTVDVIFLACLKFKPYWRDQLCVEPVSWKRLCFEILICSPVSLLYLSDECKSTFEFHLIIPIIALARSSRVMGYFRTKSSQAGGNQWSTFLFRYLMMFFISQHTLTCIWYFYAYKDFDVVKMSQSWTLGRMMVVSETITDWYIRCCYWSVMLLSTNALGEIYPVTTAERLIAIIASLTGFVLMTVVFVGSLTSMFLVIFTRKANYVLQLKHIVKNLELIKMDKKTTQRILGYYEDLWIQKSGVIRPAYFKLLPHPLQMEICYDLNVVPLHSSLIFRQLPESYLRSVSLVMSHNFFLPGDVIILQNEVKQFMVCITSGVVEFLYDEDDESPMISFTKGTCFGEISLVYGAPARCTVRAATYVECQILNSVEFRFLMMAYPDIQEQIRDEVKVRIYRSQQKKMTEDTQFNLSVYATKSRKKGAVKLVKDKLRYLQGHTDIDNVDESRLNTDYLSLYILSENKKMKVLKLTCLNSEFPWVLEADCKLVRYWEGYMLILVFYICIVYPFHIGYDRSFPDYFLVYSEFGIMVSLIVNILLSMITSIRTKKGYIKDIRGIINYKMNTLGFYLDLFSIILFENLVTLYIDTEFTSNYIDHLFYVCKGIKLCLVWRISNLFLTFKKRVLVANIIFLKVAKYVVYITMLCYWCGVILYMESCFTPKCSKDSWFHKVMTYDAERKFYNRTETPIVTASYLATSLLISVGYGDFVPGDQYDMFIFGFLSLYGTLLVGYCIAEFSAVITHWSRPKTAFLELMMTMQKFLEDNAMKPSLRSRIMSFYELQWQYNEGADLTGTSWLQQTIVPEELKKKVLHQARFKSLTAITFFRVRNKAFIQRLTEKARDILLPPGDVLRYGGTVSRELYIIEKGYCEVLIHNDRGKLVKRVIGPGSNVGLFVLLYGTPSMSSVITLTHCKVLCIEHSAYTAALSMFPEMTEHIGLMSQSELDYIENISHKHGMMFDVAGKRHEKIKRDFHHTLTDMYHDFINDSIINLRRAYMKQNLSYKASFRNFKTMQTLAPYVLMPYILKPDGPILKIWLGLRITCAFFLCIIRPINTATSSTVKLHPAITFAEIICIIDLYVMLHVGYYGQKNQLIYHPYMTARHYLTGAFLIDFILSCPLHSFMFIVNLTHPYDRDMITYRNHYYYCTASLWNIMQIYKVIIAFWKDPIMSFRRAYCMNVFLFVILTIFFLNFYTCIIIIYTCQFVVAENELDLKERIQHARLSDPFVDGPFKPEGNIICEKNSWLQNSNLWTDKDQLTAGRIYLMGFYFVTASFMGCGFGDVTAHTSSLMILIVFINIHGCLFFGYVYASIAATKAIVDLVSTKFQENLKDLSLFFERESVSMSLRKRLNDYWRYQWKRSKGWSPKSILGKLHANLNEDAVLHLYERTLKEMPLFENVEVAFFRAFAKKLSEVYFLKRHMVTRQNEVISSMFIIYRGKVDVMSHQNEVETSMGPGGIFGNIKGSKHYLTLSTIVASRNTDLLVIDGAQFYALLKSYPAVLKKVMNSVSKTTKDYVLPMTIYDNDSFAQMQRQQRRACLQPGSVGHEDLIKMQLPEDILQDDDSDFGHGSSSQDVHETKSLTSSRSDYVEATLLLLKPHRWFRGSILPDCFIVTFFEYLILLLSYADFVLTTYQMAFLSIKDFLYISISIDFLFYYKLFLDIHTAYLNKYGDYVLDPSRVRAMYFANTILRRRDFLANLPVCYFVYALGISNTVKFKVFAFARIPQLLRITYLLSYEMQKKGNVAASNFTLKLLSITVWASLIAHVSACLFFVLSCLTESMCLSVNWITKADLDLIPQYYLGNCFSIYVTSLWFVVNLITITAAGDVAPQNTFETIETIIIVIAIKFGVGLLISEFSALISTQSSSRTQYDYGVCELRDGMRDIGLSTHQLKKMWDYVKELWNRHQGKQMPTLIVELPLRLRCQLMEEVYGKHIEKCLIFGSTEVDFKKMLVSLLDHCVFFPGNYIVQCGEADQCIYFIHRGEVEILTVHKNLTESVYDVLGPEDSFGLAQGLYVGISHKFSYRAKNVVDVVYLKLDKWKFLLDFYPVSSKKIGTRIQNMYLSF